MQSAELLSTRERRLEEAVRCRRGDALSARKMLETIDLALRVLKAATEVELSAAEVGVVRKIALAYLDSELGVLPHE